MTRFSDQEILDSWHKNADAWTTAVRQKQIDSRRLTTDQAIIDRVLAQTPQSVLDLGCGEGWLVRELSDRGINAQGFDAVPELVRLAQQQSEACFQVMDYQDLATAAIRVDLVVCNFSLLGKESVEQVFSAVPLLLNPGGALVVQTLHPQLSCAGDDYRDGWREGSWQGFSDQFTDPAPWYFRTLESWRALFENQGFQLQKVREPLNPATGKPASVIMIGQQPG